MKRILLIVLAALTLHTLSAAEPAACGRETYPLDGGWHFSFRTENSSDNARIVTLPHTWNTDPRADDRNFLRTEANYVRKIRVPGRADDSSSAATAPKPSPTFSSMAGTQASTAEAARPSLSR